MSMVDYIKNQLSEQGVLNKANTSKTNISYEDILFEESTHLLDELQDLSIDGKDGPDETRKMNVGIPVSDDDDFEIDTIEFNMVDGRVTDVPMDAALQESFYEHMFHYNDFYQEAVNTMRRFPRESEDMFMDRVNTSAKKKYDQYMEQVVQEGLFGFGKVNINSDKIRWNIHLNFGKFTEERNEECIVTLGVCYETTKNKVYKKQVETVGYYDYVKFTNARDTISKWLDENNMTIPKGKGIWDVMIPKKFLVPIKPMDEYAFLICYECTIDGKDHFFGGGIPIKTAKHEMKSKNHDNIKCKEFSNSLTESKQKTADFIGVEKKANIEGFVDERTVQESMKFDLTSFDRFDGFYQEAIDFGGGGDPPVMNDNSAEPSNDASPEMNDGSNDTTNVDAGNNDTTPSTDSDTNNGENPNVNDVSDQIADKVNGELEAQKNEDQTDQNLDDDDTNTGDLDDINTSPTDDTSVDSSKLPTEEPDGVSGDVDVDNMTIDQLLEQGGEKLKGMTIQQLKDFLNNGDAVQEAFIYTKKNINNELDILLRKTLGILNDSKLEINELVKQFKSTGKKLNRCLNKAIKMVEVYNDEERKSFGVLNSVLVSLLSAIKSDSKGEDLNNIKKLLKEFATQSKTVGSIIEKHMN